MDLSSPVSSDGISCVDLARIKLESPQKKEPQLRNYLDQIVWGYVSRILSSLMIPMRVLSQARGPGLYI